MHIGHCDISFQTTLCLLQLIVESICESNFYFMQNNFESLQIFTTKDEGHSVAPVELARSDPEKKKPILILA